MLKVLFFKQNNILLDREFKNSLSNNIFGIGFFKSFLISCRLGLSFPFFSINLNNYNSSVLISILNFYTWLKLE